MNKVALLSLSQFFLFLIFSSNLALAQPQEQPFPHPSQASQDQLNQQLEQMQQQVLDTHEQMLKYQEMMKKFNTPYMRKLMAIASNEKVRSSLTDVMETSQWKKVLVYQLIFFLMVIVFKAWRMSKTEKWFHRLWVSFYSMLILIAALSFISPRLAIGPAYTELVKSVYQAYKAPPA